MLQPSLNVRYWKRMRPNKVYPVFVTCKGQGEAAPVTLRVVMAGAQVVPAEQIMDLSNPGEKVTFYVTPLAKGSLRAERVEVLQDGRKIQELRIPCKACTQRPTLVWLILAFVIPWLILHYLVYSPIGYLAPLNADGTPRYVRKPSEEYAKTLNKQMLEEKTRPTEKKSPVENKAPEDGKQDDKKALEGKKQDEKKQAEDKKPVRETVIITDFVEVNTPNLKPLVSDWPTANGIMDDVVAFPERVYIHLFLGHAALGQPIAFYIFLLCIVIALLNFIIRQERRKTVRGRPLPG